VYETRRIQEAAYRGTAHDSAGIRPGCTHVLDLTGVLVISYVGSAYRRVVAAKREVHHSFSNFDRLLQERFDALGELMKLCRGYIQRDSREPRAVAVRRGFLSGVEELDRRGTGQYNLAKSTEDFSLFEKCLLAIEDRIADQRAPYNSAISRFNLRLQEFPGRWLAGVTGFTLQPHFAAPTSERLSTLAAIDDRPNPEPGDARSFKRQRSGVESLECQPPEWRSAQRQSADWHSQGTASTPLPPLVFAAFRKQHMIGGLASRMLHAA